LDVSNVSPSSSFFSDFIAEWLKYYTLPVPLLRSWKCPYPSFLVIGVGGPLLLLASFVFYLTFSGSDSAATGALLVLTVANLAAYSCCCL
jgi:hypothetical protein